jgi:small subunit ribosomal protein S21
MRNYRKSNSEVKTGVEKIRPLEVVVERDFEGALRAFKALVQKEKILTQYKDKQVFEKPSVKKRRKRRESQRRRIANEAKQKLIQSGEWEKLVKRRQEKKRKKLILQQKQRSETKND